MKDQSNLYRASFGLKLSTMTSLVDSSLARKTTSWPKNQPFAINFEFSTKIFFFLFIIRRMFSLHGDMQCSLCLWHHNYSCILNNVKKYPFTLLHYPSVHDQDFFHEPTHRSRDWWKIANGLFSHIGSHILSAGCSIWTLLSSSLAEESTASPKTLA